MTWLPIKTAPKKFKDNLSEDYWILGKNTKTGECRVMTFCNDYPHTKGVWKYGESYHEGNGDDEGYDDILCFEPDVYQELPK